MVKRLEQPLPDSAMLGVEKRVTTQREVRAQLPATAATVAKLHQKIEEAKREGQDIGRL